jgi:hypothetical protein
MNSAPQACAILQASPHSHPASTTTWRLFRGRSRRDSVVPGLGTTPPGGKRGLLQESSDYRTFRQANLPDNSYESTGNSKIRATSENPKTPLMHNFFYSLRERELGEFQPSAKHEFFDKLVQRRARVEGRVTASDPET